MFDHFASLGMAEAKQQAVGLGNSWNAKGFGATLILECI